jgi:hypothetical protein
MRIPVPALLLALVGTAGAAELTLVTLDPAHFHASQLHSGALPGFSRDAYVYAPVGSDLGSYWNSVAVWTAFSQQPDFWRFHAYAGPDYLARMQAEHPGNVLFLSGRNRRKIEYLEAGLKLGMHALADKPWIIEAADFDRLKTLLAEADRRGLVYYDCMSQRYEIAYQIVRELVADPEIFGQRQPGTAEKPAAEIASSHFLVKMLNGVARTRPAWYFDIREQGEALADVGTHYVDLAHWTLFPDQVLDYRQDIRLLKARRWPTVLTLDEFKRAAGEPGFTPAVQGAVRDRKLYYYTNNRLLYTTRGVHISVQVAWEYASPAGDKDRSYAIYRGTRSEVAALAQREQGYVFEVQVTPNGPAEKARVKAALTRRLAALSTRWPGLGVQERGNVLHVVIPGALRVNDVEYFLSLARTFAGYVRQPGSLPEWEKSGMLVKYYITTRGVELARATEDKLK